MDSATLSMLNDLTNKLPVNERPPASDSALPDWMNTVIKAAPSPLPVDLLEGLLKPAPAEVNYYDHSAPVEINPPGEEAPLEVAMLEEKPKRVRRTKAQMAALKETGLPEPYAGNETPTEAAPADTLQAPMAAPIPVPSRGWTLYVNCTPGKGADVFDDANDLFALANAQILQDLGVPDYRMVDFGKGTGAFVACVNDLAADRTVDLLLDTASPEGALCLAGLTARATRVVRGSR